MYCKFFNYDAVNRLTAANFTQYYNGSFNGSSGINYTANNLSYDANGNILSMNQYGLKKPASISSQLIDQLTYTYLPGSNRLQKVVDAVNDSSSVLGDFKYLQKNKTDTDYVYDANGNLIADKNKNISNIAYNILNLPQTITVAGKGTITYTYDAVGNKLRKQTVEGSKTTTTLYAGSIVYENDTLRFISHEEGRTRVSNNSNYVYDYYLKDHLGNVRMTITDDTIQPTPVIDATSYYPFGLTMSGVSVKAMYKLENDKKYNGIELNEDLGLNIYDAFFRNLDPQIGRWWQIDPKIESMEMWSPYASNYNSPIRFSDPLGDEPDVNEEGPGIGSRIVGGLKAIGGLTEMSAGAIIGVATSWSVAGAVVGGAAVIHGADNLTAGLRQTFGGTETKTITEQVVSSGLQTAGVSKQSAEAIGGFSNDVLSIGLTIGAGALVNAPSKITLSSQAAENTIQGHTMHGLNQSLGRDGGRGVSAVAKLDAVRSPMKKVVQDDGAVKYVGKKAIVILTNEGKIVTTFGKARGHTQRIIGNGNNALKRGISKGIYYDPNKIR